MPPGQVIHKNAGPEPDVERLHAQEGQTNPQDHLDTSCSLIDGKDRDQSKEHGGTYVQAGPT